ncbi:hypothetical protein UFOVP264_25 [uncultured Caudovirales phage]|uniref:Uncharacterized protein n=1 Tax=uncultured Caudovirales phage TaxID=2100421 RepID=A0A6J5LHZ4_9CAUD|nr:hypothetical protein UFOVP264_25 [uncultured Caudovirales phage]
MSESNWKEYPTTPEMNMFFYRLSLIKSLVKVSSKLHPSDSVKAFALGVYQQLNELYKTQEEHENYVSNTSNPSN